MNRTLSCQSNLASWCLNIHARRARIRNVFINFQTYAQTQWYEGTGIGLAHVRKIIELHKGKIRVESTPGEGSTFILQPKMIYKYEEKLNVYCWWMNNESDNFLHKRMIEKPILPTMYNRRGWKEALDFFLGKREFGKPESSYCRPELIFLDINMPVMDGWNFFTNITNLKMFNNGKTVVIHTHNFFKSQR